MKKKLQVKIAISIFLFIIFLCVNTFSLVSTDTLLEVRLFPDYYKVKSISISKYNEIENKYEPIILDLTDLNDIKSLYSQFNECKIQQDILFKFDYIDSSHYKIEIQSLIPENWVILVNENQVATYFNGTKRSYSIKSGKIAFNYS